MLEFKKEQEGFAYPFTSSFTFEKGEHRGENYRIQWSICENPLCTCEDVEFAFEGVDDGPPGVANDMSRYVFSLDVGEKRIVSKDDRALSTATSNFARAFMKDLDTNQWNDIQTAFYSYKVHVTKNCDIEELNPAFPMEQIEYEGIMVGWQDIFPYAEDISINDGPTQYYFDDQYCINSTCSCKDVALAILPIENGIAQGGDSSPAVRYNYMNGKWKLETLPADNSQPVGRIMGKLSESLPDLSGTLKTRHGILRRLYGKYRQNQGLETTGQPKQKIGRNEPCPCGSGKKYKMCCGR